MGLLQSVCQVIMLILLISEIYVIKKLYGYKNTRFRRYILMLLGTVQIAFLMFTMVNPEKLRPYFITFTVVIGIFLYIFYRKIYKWSQNRISVDAIKEGLDDLPVGVCFYETSGRPVLINNKMDYISKELVGVNFIDGNEFWNNIMAYNKSQNANYAVDLLPDGNVYMFKRKIFNDITEVTATNITKEYRLSNKLERDNESLKQHNNRLKEYNKNIEKLTIEKEILETKVHIHDNLGRMLLLAKKSLANPDDFETRKEVLKVWNANNELLIKADEGKAQDLFENIRSVAETIGVNILYSGNYPKENCKITDIMINGIHECITNTVSHADGNEVYVVFSYFNNKWIMTCENNGKQPKGEITEGGGLSSLRKRVETAGGKMTLQGIPRFTLKIELESI